MIYCKLVVQLEMYELEKYFLKNSLITSSGNDIFSCIFLFIFPHLPPSCSIGAVELGNSPLASS